MKVLLVNPEFPDTYWSFRHALPFEGKRCAFPPLGLLTVSALLPQSWERRLVDLNVQPLKSAPRRSLPAKRHAVIVRPENFALGMCHPPNERLFSSSVSGVRVSPKAFGKDRRLPITNRWFG